MGFELCLPASGFRVMTGLLLTVETSVHMSGMAFYLAFRSNSQAVFFPVEVASFVSPQYPGVFVLSPASQRRFHFSGYRRHLRISSSSPIRT